MPNPYCLPAGFDRLNLSDRKDYAENVFITLNYKSEVGMEGKKQFFKG